MPETWIEALKAYNYPVRLSAYNRAGEFPGFFTQSISGDRDSTIEFEDYFRAGYADSVEPYFEVVFWKQYRFKPALQRSTDRIVKHVLQERVEPSELTWAIDLFIDKPTAANLSVLRALLGIKGPFLALALTFPAFIDPKQFPMVDRQTAKWITSNHSVHNRYRSSTLTNFKVRDGVVQDNDFQNYLNWAKWCRETGQMLAHLTNTEWRARDVEMAVFAAARGDLLLNPLP